MGEDEYVEGYVVRARGLPWSATPQDLTKFFSGKNKTLYLKARQKRDSFAQKACLESPKSVKSEI